MLGRAIKSVHYESIHTPPSEVAVGATIWSITNCGIDDTGSKKFNMYTAASTGDAASVPMVPLEGHVSISSLE